MPLEPRETRTVDGKRRVNYFDVFNPAFRIETTTKRMPH